LINCISFPIESEKIRWRLVH